MRAGFSVTDNNAGQSQEICAVKLFSLKVLTMHIFNESFFLGSSYFLKVVRNETFFYLHLSGVKSEYAVERLRLLSTRGL